MIITIIIIIIIVIRVYCTDKKNFIADFDCSISSTPLPEEREKKNAEQKEEIQRQISTGTFCT